VTVWRTLLDTVFSLRQWIRPVFEAHGLTGPQWRVLRLLAEAGAPGMRLSDISEQLIHTPGNTTGIVDKLEERGLAERHPHPEDRRATLVRLTEAGRAVHAAVAPGFAERVEAVLSSLTAEERGVLQGMLERLREQARELAEGDSLGRGPDCSGRR